jgi:hypothetical protein
MTDSTEAADPRVWVLDMNAFDYSPAESFGELRLLKSDQFAPGAIDDTWNAGVIQSLRAQLLEYRPMVDFLIPTGKPIKMCIASMLAAERGPRHKFLAWDQRYYRYVPYSIDLLRS